LLPRSARGRVALVGGGRCLWSPSVLGPLPHPRHTEADRSGGVQPHRCCCGPVTSGWTPPARSAWLRPRTRQGTQNTHPRVVRRIHRTTWPVQAAPHRPRSRISRGPISRPRASVDPSHHKGVVSWVPCRVRGRSQAGWAGGVRPDETGGQQQRSGLMPPDQSASVWRGCGKGPRTLGDHKQRPPPTSATRPRAERGSKAEPSRAATLQPDRSPPLAEEPAGGPALDLRCPPNAAAARPPDVCAVTRTHARHELDASRRQDP